MSDFYVNNRPSDEFGARLLASYSVGGTQFERTRVVPAVGQRFTPGTTRYGLRSIQLPVHIQGRSPEHAAHLKSELDAALLQDPVELYLPDGRWYTASLDSIGEATEVTQDGCLLATSYTLSGFAHGALQRVQCPAVPEGSTTLPRFHVDSTASEVECRITVTTNAAVGPYTVHIGSGTVTLDVVVAGTYTMVIDGLTRRLLVNGHNMLALTDLVTWPVLAPGWNTVYAADPLTVEYYPVWR